MGASVVLPERRPPPPVRTPEMALVPERDLVQVMPRLMPGDERQPLGVGDDARKAALQAVFPEFAIVSSAPGMLAAARSLYMGDPRVCCKGFGISHYWEKGAMRANAFFSGGALRTCDPARFDAGACDDLLFRDCAAGAGDSDLCAHWINAAVTRRTDRRSRERLNDMFARDCGADAARPHCVAWIRAMRSTNSAADAAAVDAVLSVQSPEFKRAHMRCSYPTPATLEMAAYVDEPRECWDPECAAGNVDFMLSDNYENLGLCRISRCSIGITHLRLDGRSRLRMRCAGALNAGAARGAVNQTAVVEENARRGFAPRTETLGVLALCVVYLLIVWL
ncbi:putative myristylated protein [Parapoxvirus red deer/HL953]|uniref:Putative myristylated protein n=1 Tax=Parapoxvirus red deer/HL953 TaxID=1579460 RepID=A0A0A7MC36_9POXV|nr:putative myristylated protein [Parapoxvirus red deer/HL953]AIZ77297.1 putative myristylated protein [Parapoxvirus red deer/HL953]